MVVAIAAGEQDVYPPRVLVSVTGLTLGDDIEVYRSIAGTRTLLRGGSDVDVTDTSFLRVDAELPYGVPVTYVAVVNATTEYATGATTYTLPGGKVVMSDGVAGLAAEVVILAWPEKVYAPPSSLFKVGDRNVSVTGPVGQYEGTADLYIETTSSLQNLYALLRAATSGIIQVRQPGGYDGVDSYIVVHSFRERRWSQDGSDQRRIMTLQVAENDSWAQLLEIVGYTLQDFGDAYATLQEMSDEYPTLLDLAQADLAGV